MCRTSTANERLSLNNKNYVTFTMNMKPNQRLVARLEHSRELATYDEKFDDESITATQQSRIYTETKNCSEESYLRTPPVRIESLFCTLSPPLLSQKSRQIIDFPDCVLPELYLPEF